jgi:hypothetical protein
MEFEFNSIQIQLTTNDMRIGGEGIQNLLVNMELEIFFQKDTTLKRHLFMPLH